ncbi:Cof-type HAD-IIB family hydrolase [Bacillus niameyensis]|uniref:Cof-type HAD-IIB family hydrolase n=1 Tax=Bacillus niameyensis TaxID=1522308 RepID=UPI0007840291|nr:Cof-type HAD-IIB family hydrolase [Bacillus niameyensis]
MVYKLLALNIDGTLLQDNGRINKSTKEAIEFAQKKDVKVILSTSRNFQSAQRVAKQLKIDSQIVSHQGAFIAKELDKPVFAKRIHEKITEELVSFLESSFSCHIKIVHERFAIGNKMKLPENLVAKVMFQRTNRFSYSEQYVDSLSEELLEHPATSPKIEVYFEHKNDENDAIKAIKEMYNEVDCIEVDLLRMDIVPASISKLSGVQYICGQHGIKREEVVAIGSGMDDLTLIEWAGLGVAMGNAPSEVKQAADWLTRTNEDDGLAYMVKEHFRKQYKLAFLRRMLK